MTIDEGNINSREDIPSAYRSARQPALATGDRRKQDIKPTVVLARNVLRLEG